MTKSKTKALDLADISPAKACGQAFEFELKHPATKAPLGVFISVLGSESSEYQGHVRERTNEAMRQRFERERKGKEAEPPSVEKTEKGAIALLAAATVGWRNVVMNGEELEFSEENARKLYEQSWIRGQVDDAVHDLGNFFAD